jgi:hypothetical protein
MTSSRSAVVALVGISVFAVPAWAVDVYLNGVLITGVRGQEFENARVTLDADGNVHIHAPQYSVERQDTVDRGPAGQDHASSSDSVTPVRPRSDPQPPPPEGGRGLSRRYWLVAQASAPGMVQYRITVEINGRLVRTFDDSNVPAAPIEVTSYLRRGANTVNIVAEKTTNGERRSESSRHWLRVVISDGHIEGQSVVIDSPRLIFTRNAAQTDQVSRDFDLDAE